MSAVRCPQCGRDDWLWVRTPVWVLPHGSPASFAGRVDLDADAGCCSCDWEGRHIDMQRAAAEEVDDAA